MQPDLNLRRQRLAARLSQMVTAKPLGQLNKAGVVASFVTLARHNSKSGGILSFAPLIKVHSLLVPRNAVLIPSGASTRRIASLVPLT